MKISYTDLLAGDAIVVFDGAMGTEIQKAGVSEHDYQGHAGCSEMLNLSRPDAIESIHVAYLEAGAMAIETNTFGGSRPKLDEYGLGERTGEINRAAAAVARRAVDSREWEGPRFVCGSIGPTGFLPSSADPQLGGISFDALVEIFAEQARGLLEGGADFLLKETSQDLLEVRAAIIGMRQAMKKTNLQVPVQIQATMDTTGHMLMGSDIAALLGAVANLAPIAAGLNCSAGPAEMLRLAREILERCDIPVSMIPNAGMPKNVDGKAVYDMSPGEFAQQAAKAVKAGVRIVGGCCGTSPAHIEALVHEVKGMKAAVRESRARTFLGTGISGRELETEPRPILIGERLNTQGSRKTRTLARERNFEELNHLALEQIDRGAMVLDLCLASNELGDEGELMNDLVAFLSERAPVPFCIDTTEPRVLERALKRCPGSVLINSINLEESGRRAREILEYAREFGCAVVALTIDDGGMADTVERKVAVARRLRDLACQEFGIAEHRLYIDPLVFTLATGDRKTAGAARESLAALREIKNKMPGVRTVMGVSNVSYGLKPAARRIVNNLMLHYATEAGLDAAIFNPLHRDNVETYDNEVRELAEELLFDRRQDALARFIDYFEKSGPAAPKASGKKEEAPVAPDDKLYQTILNRDKRSVEPLIEQLLHERKPEAILNEILLPAMAEVGARMSSGDMILPFVLQAAEVMKYAVSVLEPHMEKGADGQKGKIVLATVYGDVHDIGKNLVGSILRNQGYQVIDLGKQVPVEIIVDTVRRESPDCLGLSALLVTTSQQMAACVKALHEAGLAVPVLIGGAAVNRDFAARIVRLEDDVVYRGGVHFARDAFDADRIIREKRAGEKDADRIVSRSDAAKKVSGPAPEPVSHGEVLVPPFYGTGDMLTWSPADLFDRIDKERLFKGYWRGGNLSSEAYERSALTEFEPAFEALREDALSNNLLVPRGFYGFFPVYTSDTRLYLLSPSDFHTEIARFDFPHMTHKNGRSIADYFRSEGDILAVQAVTIGGGLNERSRAFFESEDRYTMGFYANGLGNYLTEGLAERVTREIRRALFIERDQGRRYSFGYPGLPGLEDQAKLIELMGVEERLGITLTSGFQMEPEHSTLAIFVHNREASY